MLKVWHGFCNIIVQNDKSMEKEIYIILSRGDDGSFTISTYETLEKAKERLEVYLSAQKDIEGVGCDVYIDYHKYERLSVPGFVLRPNDVISHVTFNSARDGKVFRTDRYIIKSRLNEF